nr:MAG TPA: hypothetical protein [Caudoviricetes sp.]
MRKRRARPPRSVEKRIWPTLNRAKTVNAEMQIPC